MTGRESGLTLDDDRAPRIEDDDDEVGLGRILVGVVEGVVGVEGASFDPDADAVVARGLYRVHRVYLVY